MGLLYPDFQTGQTIVKTLHEFFKQNYSVGRHKSEIVIIQKNESSE